MNDVSTDLEEMNDFLPFSFHMSIIAQAILPNHRDNIALFATNHSGL